MSLLIFLMGIAMGVVFANSPIWGAVILSGVIFACCLMDDDDWLEERNGN